VHEGGFLLVPRSPGQWVILSPAGVTIDNTPPAPTPPAVEPLPADAALDPNAVSGHWNGDRMRLDDTVAALAAPIAKRTAQSEPECAAAVPESTTRTTTDASRASAS